MQAINLNSTPCAIVSLSYVLQIVYDGREMFLKGKVKIVLLAITVVFLGVLNSLRIHNQQNHYY